MYFILSGCMLAWAVSLKKWAVSMTSRRDPKERYTCLNDTFKRKPRTAPPSACNKNRVA